MTTLRDCTGYALSTGDADAASAYRIGVDRLLTGEGAPVIPLGTATRIDPDLAVAHAAIASQLRRTHPHLAEQHRQQARTTAPPATRRERQHVELLTLLDEDPLHPRLQALLSEHLTEFPRDLLVLHQAIDAAETHAGPDLDVLGPLVDFVARHNQGDPRYVRLSARLGSPR